LTAKGGNALTTPEVLAAMERKAAPKIPAKVEKEAGKRARAANTEEKAFLLFL